jgi:hypothetical protein
MERREQGDKVLKQVRAPASRQNHDAKQTTSLQLLKSTAAVRKRFVLGSPCNSSTISNPMGGGGGAEINLEKIQFNV